MKNTKLNLLAMLLSVSAGGQVYSMNIQNLPTLGAQAVEQANKLELKVLNMLNQLADGNFDGLKSSIGDLGSLDLTSVVTFLQNNVSSLKPIITQVIKNIPMDQIPAEYQAKAKQALAEVDKNLALIDNLKSYLDVIKPYANLTNYENTVVSALKTIAGSAEFKAFKPDLMRYFNTQLKPAIAKLQDLDFAALQKGIEQAPNLVVDGELDLDAAGDVAVAAGILRKQAMPAIVGLMQAAGNLVTKINDVLVAHGTEQKLQLPTELRTALAYIRDNANDVSKALVQVNDQINKALNKAMGM